MNNKKWLWILLIIVLVLVFLAAGVIYWTSFKVKNIADSVLDSSQKTPTSVPTPSEKTSSNKTPNPTLSIPAADVPGQDLADVPRFTGSVRSLDEKSDDGLFVNLEYFAKAGSKEIFDFYKNQLVGKDWVLRAENATSLNFSKDNAEVSIEIIDEDKLAKIIQYKIHWFMVEAAQE